MQNALLSLQSLQSFLVGRLSKPVLWIEGSVVEAYGALALDA